MVLLFQKRKAIESNHFICDAVGAEEVSDGFSDEEDNLNEEILGILHHP